MKKSVALKWAKALRSGKYKQTTHALKDSKGYCCLGVLCDISKQGAWTGKGYEVPTEHLRTALLPVQVRKWAEMKDSTGEFELKEMPSTRERTLLTSLAELNDLGGWSFKKIAAFIEKNWRKL